MDDRQINRERRFWLKTGFLGTMMLGFGSFALAKAAPATCWSALSEAFLAGVDPFDRKLFLLDLEQAISGLSSQSQKELVELGYLLDFPPTKALLGGGWGGWQQTPKEVVLEMIQGWSNSRFNTLRVAYVGLQELILSTYYANPSSWEAIGYPGPPVLKVQG
ncbi:MAG: hypothetical protein A2600_04335 [Candidatus Lambdaproteobacteria bacterium RIFOXYD1_FULL_56_27]|uniref:Gluconate 2-dehydrogenase subunit 3 family protein n=1 Tax=Candidatus Lambdaproteobacteria bacterium RIFOXYD2_FULL_56_26 TaxID=1817773 RepID=A0A1F6H3P1_9PROT|nr:MAG: hypothetical protein A2426_02135 [Candidatus Lambdaproteobacteria bacterium RIFOXYC1_FULL_56_13]OGH04983.1 MAG: hypothetical protein A2557_08400 [Candidatus Lambdaproteobacteria bacterium RIFOXYD2_FULL_56_26]OGH09448.1 MAG: hypothetical protein A2600_04335 [Candidatus Lambdaproteobacteria bacterium RIFOXYD1_FULL_56_27]